MVGENKVCRNSLVTRLGSDSPTLLKDEVNRDDVVDGNGYEDVNWDDAGNSVEDVNWDDVGHGVEDVNWDDARHSVEVINWDDVEHGVEDEFNDDDAENFNNINVEVRDHAE